MPTVLNISRAGAGDLSPVMELIAACIGHMRSAQIDQWDDAYPAAAHITADIAADSLYMAHVAGRLAGIVVLNETEAAEYGAARWEFHGKILVVHRLAVHPAHQGRGMAGALMEFSEDYARQNKYNSVRLDAFTQNPAALRLYEKRGYRKAGEVTFRKGRFICFEKQICG